MELLTIFLLVIILLILVTLSRFIIFNEKNGIKKIIILRMFIKLLPSLVSYPQGIKIWDSTNFY